MKQQRKDGKNTEKIKLNIRGVIKIYCKYLLKRSRKLKTVFYCRKNKTYIDTLDVCKNCLEKEYKANKPIKKVSKNKKTVSKKTYQKVYERDKGICQLCGSNQNLHLHHIMRKR